MHQNIVSAGKSTPQFFTRQRGIASSEEIRKFGKSFGLRFTAWIRLSTRHFSDDESTILVQELLLRVRDDTNPGTRGRRDSEIRIRKDSARPFSSFSFFLDKASQDRKRQKEGEKEKEEEREREEGSPEALIVSEFRVDGNPRAVLHPPAFFPRSLNIRTRLSYVEQKYENARKTGQVIARETEREREREKERKREREREREREIREIRSLKRFSVRSKQIELLRF